ncbi:MAG: cupin domain-containing protein [Candidatus Thorarchaeota archaeon]
MIKEIRRIVTGNNEEKKSTIIIDDSPFQYGTIHQFWVTRETPVDNSKAIDLAGIELLPLEPPPSGTIFRFFEIPPLDPKLTKSKLENLAVQGLSTLKALHCRKDTSKHPYMHKTETVDYIIVLEGEITLLLEETEVELKPFNVVIQQGTNHAWINKSSNRALLAGILIDAKPDD